ATDVDPYRSASRGARPSWNLIQTIHKRGFFMNIWLLCSSILVLLYFVLSLNVSRLRGKTKTGIGAGEDPSGPLNKAVRAHGNAAEYTPLFLALFLYFAISDWNGWVLWVAVIV